MPSSRFRFLPFALSLLLAAPAVNHATAQEEMLAGLDQSEQRLLLDILVNRHAKRVCSGVFLSGRSADEILLRDHDTDPRTVVTRVDRENGLVTVSAPAFPGRPSGTAAFRNGLGCTILFELSPEQRRPQPTGRPRAATLDPGRPRPEGSAPELATPTGVDRAALEAALEGAFSEPFTDKVVGTRGVAVVYDGELVAERYAPGFAADRPLIIWSMTKSITNAMVGLLVEQGSLRIADPAAVPEWRGEGDPRGAITLDQLLRMSSGLKFEEVYEQGLIDVVVMLFGKGDTAGFAASQPLAAEPDTAWSYSSGTTNIISRVVRQAFEGDLAGYVALPHERLFAKLGMTHTVIELDESGTYVGSSFAYSTPRDLARFGQLLLQDGVWDGERLLPEGWVAYSSTPTPLAPRGSYGAQFWLNAGEPGDPAERSWPDVPADAVSMSGFEGQSVTVIPSRKAVVVRLGRTPDRSAFDLNRFLADVLAALPE